MQTLDGYWGTTILERNRTKEPKAVIKHPNLHWQGISRLQDLNSPLPSINGHQFRSSIVKVIPFHPETKKKRHISYIQPLGSFHPISCKRQYLNKGFEFISISWFFFSFKDVSNVHEPRAVLSLLTYCSLLFTLSEQYRTLVFYLSTWRICWTPTWHQNLLFNNNNTR